LEQYSDTIQDRNGNVIPGATVTVTDYPSGTTSTTYATNAPGSSTNPITADSNGQYSFYAIDGSYTITTSKSGITTSTKVITLKDNSSVIDVKGYGAVGDGVTDDAAAINAAITAAAVDGGTVYFATGNYKHNSAITLASNVTLMGYGATLTWGGGSSAQITTPTTGVLIKPGVIGLKIDGGASATTLLELFSVYSGTFRDLYFDSNLATNIVMDLRCNTSGSTNADGNRCFVFSEFSNISSSGVCGTFLRLKGESGSAVVTACTFNNINALTVAVRGIDFTQWCDSNYFGGITGIFLTAINAVGVEYNTGSPTSNVGVYANNFAHLYVNTFGSYAGRVGMKMNLTKLNNIEYYFQDPVAEGGDFITTSDTISYRVLLQKGATNNLYMLTKGMTWKGSNETLTADSPVEIAQTWNNAGVNFNALNVNVTATASGASSVPVKVLVGGVTQWFVDKAGVTLQRGSASIGYGLNAETSGIDIGAGRTGSGIAYIDLIGDTTNADYGTRWIRGGGGANTTSQILHKGSGSFTIKAEDAGSSLVFATNAATRISMNDTGIGFFGATAAAKPTVTGSRGGNAALADLLTELATLGLITDSSTA